MNGLKVRKSARDRDLTIVGSSDWATLEIRLLMSGPALLN